MGLDRKIYEGVWMIVFKICEILIYGDFCDVFVFFVIIYFLNNMIWVLFLLLVFCVGGELVGVWEKVDILDMRVRDIFYNSLD